LYLQYDSEKDFVIDLDNIYKWLGFTRKDNAKRLLVNHFKLDIDYKIMTPPIGGSGKNKETILMNVKTFKKFCMKADTSLMLYFIIILNIHIPPYMNSQHRSENQFVD
jgi:hypothetical protein